MTLKKLLDAANTHYSDGDLADDFQGNAYQDNDLGDGLGGFVVREIIQSNTPILTAKEQVSEGSNTTD